MRKVFLEGEMIVDSNEVFADVHETAVVTQDVFNVDAVADESAPPARILVVDALDSLLLTPDQTTAATLPNSTQHVAMVCSKELLVTGASQDARNVVIGGRQIGEFGEGHLRSENIHVGHERRREARVHDDHEQEESDDDHTTRPAHRRVIGHLL